MWTRTCVFKLPLCENCAPQVSHLNGFSVVWIRTWFFKLPLSENCAPQELHLYGLCTVWIQTWFFKLPLCENCASQVSYLHGFSPVWMRSCYNKTRLRKQTCTKSATFELFHNSPSVYIPSHIEYTSTGNLFPFYRFLPLRGSTLVSSTLYCIKRYVTTKSALVHDWIILSETCKAQVPLLKFVTNVSVKMQALTHHVFCNILPQASHLNGFPQMSVPHTALS